MKFYVSVKSEYILNDNLIFSAEYYMDDDYLRPDEMTIILKTWGVLEGWSKIREFPLFSEMDDDEIMRNATAPSVAIVLTYALSPHLSKLENLSSIDFFSLYVGVLGLILNDKKKQV